jgi:hypothetical protein
VTLKLKLQLAISVAVLVSSFILVQFAMYAIRSQAAADVARIRAEKTAQVAGLTDRSPLLRPLDAQYHEAADQRLSRKCRGRAILT